MRIRTATYANCDDVFLVWRAEEKLENCLGFAIYRRLLTGTHAAEPILLNNRMGFKSDHPKKNEKRPSNVWPFQRFNWTDHGANDGQQFQYRIVPVFKKGTQRVEDETLASEWTNTVDLAPDAGKGFSCYFNRGLVMSQFMARRLGAVTKANLTKFKKQITDQVEDELRQFLYGELGKKLIELLDDTFAKGGTLFAALYELSDKQLIESLCRFKRRANVVLANGSDKAGDGNEDARETLKAANVRVFDRLLGSKGLGHNKFLVICDADGNAQAVWTGSTNWASTGLCTQINNGLLIKNKKVSQSYLDQWQRLKAAKNLFPPDLKEANAETKSATVSGAKVDVIFSPTPDRQDLAAAREVIRAAKQGILFLMFMPGTDGLLQAVTDRLSPVSADFDPKLYVQGVVSSITPQKTAEGDQGEVALIGHGQRKNPLKFKVIQPEGIKHPVAEFAAEVTRNDFLISQGGAIGMAIVHSKILVIDPFGDSPVVITGSNNFSKSASQKNDENLVIIHNNPDLARAYAVNIVSVYQHYRWRAFLLDNPSDPEKDLGYLKESDSWQNSAFDGGDRQKELEFWLP